MTLGPVRFCRYAYAPNALGYCGPDDHRALLEYGANQVVDEGLRQLARGFEGAWPYLSLIADVSGIEDPLDDRVVEAYWLGNGLLMNVDPATSYRFLEERFRPRMGARRWGRVDAVPFEPGSAHHNHHVFLVYPWVGMLRLEGSLEPLRVLQNCRIRTGRVVEVLEDGAVVASRPLEFDGSSLYLGAVRNDLVRIAEDGLAFATPLAAGDIVSLHWDWVCERITTEQATAVSHATRSAMRTANAILAGSVDLVH
jgi:hypothetical protein